MAFCRPLKLILMGLLRFFRLLNRLVRSLAPRRAPPAGSLLHLPLLLLARVLCSSSVVEPTPGTIANPDAKPILTFSIRYVSKTSLRCTDVPNSPFLQSDAPIGASLYILFLFWLFIRRVAFPPRLSALSLLQPEKAFSLVPVLASCFLRVWLGSSPTESVRRQRQRQRQRRRQGLSLSKGEACGQKQTGVPLLGRQAGSGRVPLYCLLSACVCMGDRSFGINSPLAD